MTEPHLDVDALADVLAGEPSAPLELHLEGCASCRAALQELQGALVSLGGTLTSLPEPVLPDAVARRIDAALAAERAGSPSGAAGSMATVTPLDSRRRGRWLAIASGVAAAAALVFGAIVLVPVGGAHDKNSGRTSTEAAGAAIPSSSTGNDYRKDGTALQLALPELLTGQQGPAISLDAKAPGATSATGPPGTTQQLPARTAPHALAALREPKALAACLAALTDVNDPGVPLALDYAQFEGQPALVVVLPASKPDKVDVFVVGAGCSQADAKVLFFTKLAKP